MEFDLTTIGKPPSAMNEAEFVAAFGGIYEHSPWVARAAFRRRLSAEHDTVAALAAALAACVDAADDAARLALIRAHPDLAGRAALGAASSREQAGAGIDACSPQEYDHFQFLNTAYREKFGFPFVMAVQGSDRRTILAAFEARLANDTDTELQRAIAEIHRIARLRLEALGGAPQ